MSGTIFETIKMRRDTLANWTVNNPILEQGEIGYEYDTYRIKFGNGITHYLSLPYIGNVYSNSVTTMTVGTGSKTFLLDVGLAFAPNMVVTISYATDPTVYMIGVVTSYNPTTGYIIINVTSVAGSGSSLTSWIIWASSGAQGPQGVAGPQGIQGTPGNSGTNGVGVPSGGEVGQILAKSTVTDYATEWIGQMHPSARQTVLSSLLDANGLPNFISVGTGLSVNIAALATPILLSFAAGFDELGEINYIGEISADTTIPSLTANVINYLYAERNAITGAITLGATPYKPNYDVVSKSQYASTYPTQDASHVKALYHDANFYPYFATDPTKSLTGTMNDNSWRSVYYSGVQYRFHVDLGTAKLIDRIMVENFHDSGTATDNGVGVFEVWGSNTGSSFAELTYGTDTGWDLLTTSKASLVHHYTADVSDPQYITVTNTTPYRYYAVKCVSSDGVTSVGIRRIEFQQKVDNSYWFDIINYIMNKSVSSVNYPKQIVFLGEALCGVSTVTSVVNYALNGVYNSGNVATTAILTTKNHNIGTDLINLTLSEGEEGGRRQIASVDLVGLTHKSVSWVAALGTSRLIIKRLF